MQAVHSNTCHKKIFHSKSHQYMLVLCVRRSDRTQQLSLEWNTQVWFSHEVYSSHGCISNTSASNTINTGDWVIFAILNYFTNDTKNYVISLNTHVKISTSYTINNNFLHSCLGLVLNTKQKTQHYQTTVL